MRGARTLLLIGILLPGCLFRRPVQGPGDPEIGVRITWEGHSCFRFQDSVGRTFLIDPFDDTIGYTLHWEEPDAVLVTHDHFDHNHRRHLAKYELVESTGSRTVAGVEIVGGLADHDNEGGRRHGPTRIFVWSMGGLRLAHLGDIGQAALRPEQKALLNDIDVLFVPVGGQTTVDAAGAEALVKEISPRVVVPMHYGTRALRFFPFDPVDAFLKRFENVVELPDADFQIRRASLPVGVTVYVPAVPE
jgi:L-ascorbate metabolism protein UlaG (beta-lactamase superfamily)